MSEDNPLDILIIPSLDHIYQDPLDFSDQVYTHHISLDNFLIMINYITTNQTKQTRIHDLNTEGVDFESELFIINYLSKYELALLSFHILRINEDRLGHDLVNTLHQQISSKYIPPWKNTQIPIDQGIREIFLSDLDFSFSNTLQHEIKRIFTLNKEQISDRVREDIINLLPASSWPVIMIIELVDQLEMLEESDIISMEELISITRLIEPHLLKAMEQPYITISRKSAIGFIIFNWRMNRGDKELAAAQELLDKLWMEWDKHDSEVYETLRYSFLALYARLINRLFRTSIDFFARRALVISLRSKLESETKEFGYLLHTIFSSSKIHPWLLKQLINGFDDYISVIFDYLKMLPESEEKESLSAHLVQVASLYRDLIIEYFVSQNHLPHPSDDVTTFVDQLGIKLNPQHLKYDIYAFFDRVISALIFVDAELVLHQHYIYLLDLWLKIIQQTDDKELLFLYEIDILLLTKQYPFLPVFEMIKQECQDEDTTILSSETFEERVVSVIIRALEYLAIRYEDAVNIDYRAYDILLYFTAEWLQVFSTEHEFFVEASTILSTVIGICFTNITRAYFKNKMVEKAFLCYLNLYYFSEYLNKVIYSMSSVSSVHVDSALGVSEKFKRVSQDWQFNNLIDIEEFNAYAKEIEVNLLKSVTETPVEDTMIGDDLLFGYLDLNDAMKEFFALDINEIINTNFENLKELAIYQDADNGSLSRLARIGATLTADSQLPIPIFRNIEVLTAALGFETIEFSYDSINNERISRSISDLW